MFFFIALTPFGLSEYKREIYDSLPQKVKDIILDSYIYEIRPEDLPNIPLNYLNSLFFKTETLEIDINQLNLDKIRYAREEALKKGNLIQSKESKAKAVIKYSDKTYNIKLRLKGDVIDHLYGSQWSFRIELEPKESLFGMRKFSLQTPKTRNYLGEWIFHKLLKNEGLPYLRYKLVNVLINGKDLGIYSIEEHFDKFTIENNQYREGPILALDEERWWMDYSRNIRSFYGSETQYEDDYITRPVKVFDSKRTLSDENLKYLYAYGSKLLDTFINDETTISDVFEIEKLARYLAIVDLNGSSHSLHWNNLRLYLNPITKKLIPIGFDSNGGQKINSLSINNSSLFHEKVLLDREFMQLYAKNIQRISKKSYWDNFISSNASELKQKNALINRTYPWYRYKKFPEYIKHNQEFITQSLKPVLPLNAYLEDFSRNQIRLNISNKILFPIEIVGVFYKDDLLYMPEEIKILESRGYKSQKYNSIKMTLKNNSTKIPIYNENFKLGYKLFGTNELSFLKINNFSRTDIDNISLQYFSQKDNIKDFAFIEKDLQEKTLTFKKGNHTISKPLITPRGFKLIANGSTSITIEGKGLILSNGPIQFIGNAKDKLSIRAIKGGRGIYVLSAKEDSKIEHASFRNINSGNLETSNFPGALTFYESNIFINKVTIDSINSEDSLNIFRSKYDITNSTFSNTKSDALDIDFGSGKLENLRFFNIGNDAIYISGSNALLKNIYISNAADKGISIGEKSKVLIEGLTLEKTAIGLASKDFSITDIKDIQIRSTEVGFAVFQKKPEYGPAKINVTTNESISNPFLTDKLYLLETPSVLIINNKEYAPNVEKVEEYLYGKTYGKESIR